MVTPHLLPLYFWGAAGQVWLAFFSGGTFQSGRKCLSGSSQHAGLGSVLAQDCTVKSAGVLVGAKIYVILSSEFFELG